MTISDFAIRRPVASIVMSLVIVLFGVVGFSFLGIRLYPAIDPPIINVQTNYTGANADIIESQITEPLEKALNGIEGIRSISSSSTTGLSNIVVEFNVGADLEKAANDVRDKASQASRNLPQDIDAPPIVTKADANADPIITLSVQSTTMNPGELSDYSENILQEKLQTIPGVSAVYLYGQKRPAMRLWLDPRKMSAYNLTAEDINAALMKENVDLPGGKIRGKSTELIVKTFGRLSSEDDFNNMIIRQTNDQVIRLSDIGEAVLGPENEETSVKLNGSSGISLALIPLPGANDIAVADEFYKRFDQIQKAVPPGMKLYVGYDKSKFVRQSVTDVAETLFIAIFLVVLIVFIFFRNWVIALRPLLDIPVSLIGSFFFMYIFGFSINILTLLAIVLATGLVVDDGIVVTENIYKKVEKGMDIYEAAFKGTREILFAVISTSMTLIVVFIPVIFLQGFTGRLFREFGIVLAGAVFISAFVSLTLTPVLNIMLGKTDTKSLKFYQKTEFIFVGMDNGYRKALKGFMGKKWYTLGVLGVCLVLMFVLFKSLKSELAPLEDHSIIRTAVTAPEGTDFDYMDKLCDRLSDSIHANIPEGRMIYERVGGGGGSVSSNVAG
ncbi:MAG: efflux RND transporter permease subunit, partial [Bacteroidota bacterium]|nr:efflux RND transporter permease subunit [Bacteroidota bacterium]